nr:MAG: capsid protein [Gemycircularvirus]
MPYRRRAIYRRKRTPHRRYRAVSRKTRRTYRKPVRRMSRRAILNATSRKKRNTMLTYVNTGSGNGSPVAPGVGTYVVAASNGTAISVFTPTAMDLLSGGNGNTIANEAQRTATTCYILGFSEKMRISTTSGLPWFWRRIVFLSRDPVFTQYNSADSPVYPANMSYIDTTTNGMQRAFINQSINGANTTLFRVQDLLFKGTVNNDWVDAQTAPVDTRRVKLISDRRMTIKSGNQVGTVKDLKGFYPYRHNLVYDDDENGDKDFTNYLSVTDNAGNGNMHIIDFFTPLPGGTSADQLQLNTTSTLYWHEK